MADFKEIKATDLDFSAFDIKDKWALVTAAKADGTVNTMTISWGGLGIMWQKDVAFVFIRPQRYTKEFVDEAETLSISFFGEGFKKALAYLGKVSGRDENKIEKMDLTVKKDNGTPYFEQAETVLFAKKLYCQAMAGDCFLDESIKSTFFPDKDYHYMYVVEVIKTISKK
jgi:Conserved protein/domain typically associated with flavoprotein oxygenases, DIM6/NTAB family